MNFVFRILDIAILPLLSIVFWYGCTIGALPLGKTMTLTVSYLVMLFSMFAAKKYKNRISSFLAYTMFLIGIIFLLNGFDGNVNDIILQDVLILLGVGIVAGLFKFRGYILTAAVVGFWYSVYTFATEEYKLKDLFTLYSRNIELYEYLPAEKFVIGLLGVGGLALIFVVGKWLIKLPISSNYSGGYSGGGYSGGSNYDQDNSESDYNSIGSFFENSHKSYSEEDSYGYNSNKTDTWGQTQSTIDYYSERENYGKPSWYEEKEREEKEYGLPWYAREKD